MDRGRDAGDQHEDDLQTEGGLILDPSTGVDGEQIPDPGHEDDRERRPGDLGEPVGDRGQDLGVGPADLGHQPGQHDLAADPDRGRQDVEEQPDGF